MARNGRVSCRAALSDRAAVVHAQDLGVLRRYSPKSAPRNLGRKDFRRPQIGCTHATNPSAPCRVGQSCGINVQNSSLAVKHARHTRSRGRTERAHRPWKPQNGFHSYHKAFLSLSCPLLLRSKWYRATSSVAAGMIADAVKSRGRSRHGQLAGAAMTVTKSSGREQTRTHSPGEKAQSHLHLQRPGRLARTTVASNPIGRVLRRRGGTPRVGPCSPPCSPGQTLSRGYYARCGRGERTGPVELAWL